MRSLLVALLALIATPALAQLYSYTNADGQQVFTDNPPQGVQAKPVNLLPTNSTVMPLPVRRLSPADAQKKPSEANLQYRYQKLGILSPSADQVLRANERRLSVAVHSEPQLASNHRYQLLLDNKPVGQPQSESLFYLSDVDRGSHQLQLQIVSDSGRQIAQSAASTFHLRQTTLSDRKRVNPCTKEDYGVRLECPLKEKPEEVVPLYKKIPLIGRFF